MALMAMQGEIKPMPDAAIFADTQHEPEAVYAWLEWLKEQLPFPVREVSKGDLALALGLGLILLLLSSCVNGAAFVIKIAAQNRHA